jgi:hypothetical protein
MPVSFSTNASIVNRCCAQSRATVASSAPTDLSSVLQFKLEALAAINPPPTRIAISFLPGTIELNVTVIPEIAPLHSPSFVLLRALCFPARQWVVSELIGIRPHQASGGTNPCVRSKRPANVVLWLQGITVAWMLVECAVSIYAAALARSPAILAFGADSLIEVFSATVVRCFLFRKSSRTVRPVCCCSPWRVL